MLITAAAVLAVLFTAVSFEVYSADDFTYYETKEEAAAVSVRYNGKSFDVMESDNELSLQIVRGCAENIRYEREDGDLANRLLLMVKRRGKQG